MICSQALRRRKAIAAGDESYLGLLTMAVAHALWYVGLSRIGAAAAGATALGIPLVGVAGSWLFLGESIGPVVFLAGVLILGGLHLVLAARHA